MRGKSLGIVRLMHIGYIGEGKEVDLINGVKGGI